MTNKKIVVHSVNSALVGLAELSSNAEKNAAVLLISGGGRVLIDNPDVVARVTTLLGPSTHATNPFEQRRRKEFLRRASRAVGHLASRTMEIERVQPVQESV